MNTAVNDQLNYAKMVIADDLANSNMSAIVYRPDQVEIQGVLVGQMRSYR